MTLPVIYQDATQSLLNNIRDSNSMSGYCCAVRQEHSSNSELLCTSNTCLRAGFAEAVFLPRRVVTMLLDFVSYARN